MVLPETTPAMTHTARPGEAAQIAGKWIAAFNAHDVDAILALYAPDATHMSPNLALCEPESGGRIQGHEALRKWWSERFERIPTLQYHLQNLRFEAEKMVMRYLREAEGDAPRIVEEVLHIRELIVYSEVLETEFVLI